MWDGHWVGRGVPWQFDPGPEPGGRWAEAFAAMPEYRRLGVQRTGAEAFRWHFGPMFYRGRLAPGSAKVLVIGQEGAQDESLAHRSFIGGTGARLQHLLGWFGITHSYLFLNTFVMPIFGQYTTKLRWLAQDPASPIAQHRHTLLQLAAETQDLRLVVSVGAAAQEAVATWARMRGGSLPDGVRTFHVVHPGAGAAGHAADVTASFAAAVAEVEQWVAADPGWLPPDATAMSHLGQPYHLGSAPVPFADLPFGTAWRLGRGGTSSNRRDDQTAIQLFSDDGRYNTDMHYDGTAEGSREGYAQAAGELPWVPPAAGADVFDPGPPTEAWARLLAGGEPGLDWPDFAALGLPGHPSFGFGPSYRGRLTTPAVVVLADQHGTDDLFTGRALTGDAGQRLQAWLAAAGLTKSYAIVRTLPVDAEGAPPAAVLAAMDAPQVRAIHTEVQRRLTSPTVLVALGPLARNLAGVVNVRNLPVVGMKATSEPGWRQSWEHPDGDRAGGRRGDPGPGPERRAGPRPVARGRVAGARPARRHRPRP